MSLKQIKYNESVRPDKATGRLVRLVFLAEFSPYQLDKKSILSFRENTQQMPNY